MNSQTSVLRALSPSSSKCSNSISSMRSPLICRTSRTRPPEMCLRKSIHSIGGSSGLTFFSRVMWARAQPALAESNSS